MKQNVNQIYYIKCKLGVNLIHPSLLKWVCQLLMFSHDKWTGVMVQLNGPNGMRVMMGYLLDEDS